MEPQGQKKQKCIIFGHMPGCQKQKEKIAITAAQLFEKTNHFRNSLKMS